MIPKGYDDFQRSFLVSKRQSSITYMIDNKKSIVSGMGDSYEAMKQAVYKVLHTDRYDYLIYSWNYGIELDDLFGKSVSYAIPEIKRRIVEALVQDDRIESVDDFSFESKRGVVSAVFTVHTMFGNIEAQMEVRL